MDLWRHVVLTLGQLFKAGDGPERWVTYGAAIVTWFVSENLFSSVPEQIAWTIFVFVVLLVLTLCWKEVARQYSEPLLKLQREATPKRLRYAMENTNTHLRGLQLYVRNLPVVRNERATAKNAVVSVSLHSPEKIVFDEEDFAICPWSEHVDRGQHDLRTMDILSNGISYGFYPFVYDHTGVFLAFPNSFSEEYAQTHPKNQIKIGTYLVRLEVRAENMESRQSHWFRFSVSEKEIEIQSLVMNLNLDKWYEREFWLSLGKDTKYGPWKISKS